jgi:DnaJ-class molecular chaperone
MTLDPYKVFGLDKTATPEAIRKAYKKLVKTAHPDLNPDDPTADDRFKEISQAYDILGDTEKRARFDRGEIDASGQEVPQRQYYRDFAGAEGNPYGAGRGFAGQGFESDEDMAAFFSDYLRRGGGGGQGRAQGFEHRFDMPGQDVQYRLEVAFLDAAQGGSSRITLPDGQRLEVKIPKGARDGQTIRLRGKGGPGHGKGPAGDAYITLTVADHPMFTRDGNDIRVVLPISIDEAVLGGPVEVPTIHGAVRMTIPAGASSGRTLRLRGRGVEAGGHKGDQFVELRIVLPDAPDADLEQAIRDWRAKHSYDPRRGMGK